MAKEKEESVVPTFNGLTHEQLQECLMAGATLQQVTDLSEAGFTFAHIKQLSVTLGAAKSQGAGLSAADLKEVLAAQRKALKPENDTHPGISAFSYPEGDEKHPKPPFAFDDVYFNGLRERPDALTAREVELYNRFTSAKVARNGMWRAEIRRNGSGNELHIITEPKTLDGRQSLPALDNLLLELLDGQAAVDPMALGQRVAELEATIQRMSQTAPAAPF